MKQKLDQYFTPQDKADSYVEDMIRIVGEEKALSLRWLEPSAGSGVFIEALLKQGVSIDMIDSYDIEPRHPSTVQADFLAKELEYSSYLTIGNPPYGFRSAMAIDFINRAALNSEFIGFVVPVNFRDPFKQNRLDLYLSQVYDSYHGSKFITSSGEAIGAISSSFIVWEKVLELRVKLPRRRSDHFTVVKSPQEADLAVTRIGYKFLDPLGVLPGHTHLIKLKSQETLALLLKDQEKIQALFNNFASSFNSTALRNIDLYLSGYFQVHSDIEGVTSITKNSHL